jgi:nitrogen fixation protein NifU and related proteins
MTDQNLDQLYREVILDHHRSPRNAQPIPTPSVEAEGYNPVCGDKLKLQLALDPKGTIQDVSCQSCGCSISVSSASIMGEEIRGKTVEEAREMVEQFRAMMAGKSKLHSETGDVEALEGVKKFPVRIKCALLAWATLAQGIDKASGQPSTTDVAKTE